MKFQQATIINLFLFQCSRPYHIYGHSPCLLDNRCCTTPITTAKGADFSVNNTVIILPQRGRTQTFEAFLGRIETAPSAGSDQILHGMFEPWSCGQNFSWNLVEWLKPQCWKAQLLWSASHSLCEKCYIYKRMIESDLGKAGSHTQKQTDWIINCILHDTEKSLVPVCPSKKVIHIFQSTVSHGCCCNHLHRLCPFKPAYQTECNILFTQQFYITCHTVHVTRISDRV